MKLNSECPICYEKMKENNRAKTICGHEFCLSCLIQHSKNHENCPLCRNDLVEKKNQINTTVSDAVQIIEDEIGIFNLDNQISSASAIGLTAIKSVIQMFALNVIHSYLIKIHRNKVHPSWNLLEFSLDDSNESIEEAEF